MILIIELLNYLVKNREEIQKRKGKKLCCLYCLLSIPVRLYSLDLLRFTNIPPFIPKSFFKSSRDLTTGSMRIWDGDLNFESETDRHDIVPTVYVTCIGGL